MGWRKKRGRSNRKPPARSTLRTVESRRMTLVAATSELISADLESAAALQEMLSARLPENWPPELYELRSMKYALRQLADPSEQGWSFWYLVHGQPKDRELVGICGFKGRPDTRGSIEISYSVLTQFRNQGYASEAVERLLTWAFSHQSVAEVSAETLPHLQQSIRVMKKNGFEYTGMGSEQGVVRYAVKRPDAR